MEHELKSMDEWIGKMFKDSQRRLQDLLDQDAAEHDHDDDSDDLDLGGGGAKANPKASSNGEVVRDNHKSLMNEKEKV